MERGRGRSMWGRGGRGMESNRGGPTRNPVTYDNAEQNAPEPKDFGVRYPTRGRGESFHSRRFSITQKLLHSKAKEEVKQPDNTESKEEKTEYARFSDFRDAYPDERNGDRSLSRSSGFSQPSGFSDPRNPNNNTSFDSRGERRNGSRYEPQQSVESNNFPNRLMKNNAPQLKESESMAANFPNRMRRNNPPPLKESESMGANFPKHLVKNSDWSTEFYIDAHEAVMTDADGPDRPEFVRDTKTRSVEETLNLSDPVVLSGCVPPTSVPQDTLTSTRSSGSSASGAFRGQMKMFSKAFANCGLGEQRRPARTESRANGASPTAANPSQQHNNGRTADIPKNNVPYSEQSTAEFNSTLPKAKDEKADEQRYAKMRTATGSISGLMADPIPNDECLTPSRAPSDTLNTTFQSDDSMRQSIGSQESRALRSSRSIPIKSRSLGERFRALLRHCDTELLKEEKTLEMEGEAFVRLLTDFNLQDSARYDDMTAFMEICLPEWKILKRENSVKFEYIGDIDPMEIIEKPSPVKTRPIIEAEGFHGIPLYVHEDEQLIAVRPSTRIQQYENMSRILNQLHLFIVAIPQPLMSLAIARDGNPALHINPETGEARRCCVMLPYLRDQCHIYYLDEGRMATVSMRELFHLPMMFFELPPLCVMVHSDTEEPATQKRLLGAAETFANRKVECTFRVNGVIEHDRKEYFQIHSVHWRPSVKS